MHLFRRFFSAKYGVPASQIRAYFHYQPTYYHLHIHFSYLGYKAPGISTERAHLLSSVIENIEKESSFYDQAILPFCVKESDNLFKYYEKNGFKFTPPEDDDAYVAGGNHLQSQCIKMLF